MGQHYQENHKYFVNGEKGFNLLYCVTAIKILKVSANAPIFLLLRPVLRSRSEPGHFGRSRCKGPVPGSLDKTEEILKDVLFVRSIID